ncbi:efflux transporter outer membrane subunit [Vibrio metschnikovii]|uniref:efflux transporter outer membrane subunit n=1 Tax=Vibrio metschnikovii TaxID=28172 RepID=UPI001C30288D|nr:efflux transporter outer membrane subunit [Vibrio metschnikovii]
MKRIISRKGMPLYSVLASIVALLSGCASLVPEYESPVAPVAQQWDLNGASASEKQTSQVLPDWKVFVADSQLEELISLALSNNRDLRQTLLNVEESRARYRIQRSERLPKVELQGSGTRQRTPADLGSSGQAEVQNHWEAGAGLASFELDLFGRVRNLSEAALEDYLATEQAARSVRISLIAEVIQTYLMREGAQNRFILTSQTLDSRETSLALVRQRYDRGVASALDYQEALGLTMQAKADLERINREFRQATNALGLLVGVDDINLYLPAVPTPDSILAFEIPAGLPSEVLAQRPDIQAAEHRLRARNADIGAARAAFFPRISLTGFYGSSSSELSNLFDSGQRSWSFMPRITVPIFAAGEVRANLELAYVRKDIAIAEYEQSIQTAFREVSDALAATDTLGREEQAQRALAQSSQEAVKLAEARYLGGVDNHLRYLEAQRNAFANQLALIDITTQQQIASVTLFRALGGGWRNESGVSDNEL